MEQRGGSEPAPWTRQAQRAPHPRRCNSRERQWQDLYGAHPALHPLGHAGLLGSISPGTLQPLCGAHYPTFQEKAGRNQLATTQCLSSLGLAAPKPCAVPGGRLTLVFPGTPRPACRLLQMAELGAAGSRLLQREWVSAEPKGCQGPRRRACVCAKWWTQAPLREAQGAGEGESPEMGQVRPLGDGGQAGVATAGPGEEGPGAVMAQEVPGCPGPEPGTRQGPEPGTRLRGCVPSRPPSVPLPGDGAPRREASRMSLRRTGRQRQPWTRGETGCQGRQAWGPPDGVGRPHSRGRGARAERGQAPLEPGLISSDTYE